MLRILASGVVSLVMASLCHAAPLRRATATSGHKVVSKAAMRKGHVLESSNKSGRSASHVGAVRMVTVSRAIRGRNGKLIRTKQQVAVHPPGPSYQLHPDEERYTQIQRALADRGYFKGDANGQWGADSTDALQRFQQDRKLTDTDGKINSLSLIGLGLGPAHGTTLSANPPASAPTGSAAISETTVNSLKTASSAAPR